LAAVLAMQAALQASPLHAMAATFKLVAGAHALPSKHSQFLVLTFFRARIPTNKRIFSLMAESMHASCQVMPAFFPCS